MQDRLVNGQSVRCFNVIDDASREVLHIEVDYSLRSNRVVWVLNWLCKRRATPQYIRMDNGPELVAELTQCWAEANGVNCNYIQPGKPTQNAFIERFNGSYRRGLLNAHEFESLEQLRELSQAWQDDYNNHRPHDSLKRLPPRVFAARYLSGGTPRKVVSQTT